MRKSSAARKLSSALAEEKSMATWLKKLRETPGGDAGLAGPEPTGADDTPGGDSSRALDGVDALRSTPVSGTLPVGDGEAGKAAPETADTTVVNFAEPEPRPMVDDLPRGEPVEETRQAASADTGTMVVPDEALRAATRPRSSPVPTLPVPALRGRPGAPSTPDPATTPGVLTPGQPRRGLSPLFVAAIFAAAAALVTLYLKAPHRTTAETHDTAATRAVADHTKTTHDTVADNKPATSSRPAAPRTRKADVSRPGATRPASGRPSDRPATKAAAVVQPAAPVRRPASVHLTFEAESYTVNHGTQNSFPTHASGGQTVGHTSAGDWVGYASRSMAGVHTVVLRTTAGQGGATVQIRASSATGPVLGSVFLPATADFDTFETETARLTASSSGPLYLVFLGPTAADIDTVTLSS